MESMFGSPWDFGTGFMQPPSFGSGNSMPVMPQPDLTQMFAQGMAAQGIRPQQFLQNPQAAIQAVAPEPSMGAGANPWDPTPVDMPGGKPVSLASAAAPMGNPNIQTDDPLQAQAGGAPAEVAGAKEKTIGEKLQESLKGVQAPKPPEVQKVGTPSAPQPNANIKAGELLQMILGLSGQVPQKIVPPSLNASMKGAFG